jgi:hypothetical protein
MAAGNARTETTASRERGRFIFMIIIIIIICGDRDFVVTTGGHVQAP